MYLTIITTAIRRRITNTAKIAMVLLSCIRSTTVFSSIGITDEGTCDWSELVNEEGCSYEVLFLSDSEILQAIPATSMYL